MSKFKQSGKGALNWVKKNPYKALLIPLGGYFLWKWNTNNKVGASVKIDESILSSSVNHNDLAQRLFEKMKGITFLPPRKEWEELAQLPKAVDVAKVYEIFNQRASREGYESEETLTNWIEKEIVLPFTFEYDAKEMALKRLRSLNLN